MSSAARDVTQIPSHYKLAVWQDAVDLVCRVYRLTAKLPRHERFGLIEQIHRSAVSIPSNIAEGAGRGKGKDAVRFLKIARGSLMELDTQLILCRKLGFLDETQLPRHSVRKIYAQLNGLIKYRESARA